nr:hypothetical protein [uncultured Lichenicoccus sp.]
MSRLDDKLASIRNGTYTRRDFIIADAKDGDMGPSLTSTGPARDRDGTYSRHRTRAEFLDEIRLVIEQDVVDIMLASVSNIERLRETGAFRGSGVTPAIRANDATDIWVCRGASYATQPSRGYRSADLDLARTATGASLGLYSITFNNDLGADIASLDAFAEFRRDARRLGWRYFLEVFNPNVDCRIEPALVPHYINDVILRCLAGLTRAERPEFLKIAYNGPKALEELASFDTSLVVGVLGGGAGTTRDCFELLHQAEKYGARVALFGRKINLAESPRDMVATMRQVADGNLAPEEAVRVYHDALGKLGRRPLRPMADDIGVTEAVLKAG